MPRWPPPFSEYFSVIPQEAGPLAVLGRSHQSLGTRPTPRRIVPKKTETKKMMKEKYEVISLKDTVARNLNYDNSFHGIP
ncbi:hypothetical protein KQX54_020430 [Cotesia glomerata]|uniref:Uncharacterized protein n=1 Tax=Cotesia glomerata TaxID=32391 RepID=A0AAV7HLY7_COTGL|nr:hypothetical protein KQX54_020430 [Cotesia glomerata]